METENEVPASSRTQRSHLCQSFAEELANSITHGLGALLAIPAVFLLIWQAVHRGDAWHVVSVSIYGGSLFLLYLVSCLYHTVWEHGQKKVFQILDHAFIFILIAGTYTPFLLVNLRGPLGWSLFGVVWGLAVIGIVLKALFLKRFEKQSSLIYLIMGWLVIVAIVELFRTVPTVGMIWMVLGGVCYSVGVIFFLMEKVKFMHAVWHLFVLSGSICHYFAVFYGVIPREI